MYCVTLCSLQGHSNEQICRDVGMMKELSSVCPAERGRTRDATVVTSEGEGCSDEGSMVAEQGVQGGVQQPGISTGFASKHTAQQHGCPDSE